MELHRVVVPDVTPSDEVFRLRAIAPIVERIRNNVFVLALLGNPHSSIIFVPIEE
jgi:hypothetical protein